MAPMLSLKEDDKSLRSGMRAFSTPPPTWQTRRSPMNVRMPNTERKRASPSDSPSCRRDLFHVLHKVPVGNSPYVKAKHVQLIEKDPNRAISLFWAAINAGDRVDSALKDMAVVMKQLSRSDEAIEAIKSFRHLCPIESQESLDNVLLELYKRSGRIEEEIWMLECKLKNIEEGIAFGGKRTKTARSQGKKVQISLEQERARILGNLAWAYLQQHNFGLAERHYRKALSFEPDKNKQCNLAICLMHMNRVPEAKSLLQTVGASIGNQQIDESCFKSFERACQILTKFEAQAGVEASEDLPRFLVVSCSSNESHNFIPKFTDDRVWTGESHCRNFSKNCNEKAFEHSHATSECSLPGIRSSSGSSPSTDIENEWKESSCYKCPSGQLGSSKKFKIGNGLIGKDSSLLQNRPTAASPAPILLTQPKPLWWSGKQRRVRSVEDTPGHAVRNLEAELVGSSDDNLDIMSQKPQSTSRGWRRSKTQAATVSASGGYGGYGVEDSNNTLQHLIRTRETRASGDSVNADSLWNPEVIVFGSLTTTTAARDDDIGNKISTKSASKCWADMVEEEEEESNNENLNSNVLINQFQSRGIESISQKLDAVGISKDDASANSVSKKSGVRRSLCFEKERDAKKNRRLQVFKDITPSLDSP